MSGWVSLFSIVALAPAMLGRAPEDERSLELMLCSGGALTIQLPGEQAPPLGDEDCHEKACHSGCSRKRIDRAQ